jgi:hypothetical protein
MAAVRGLASTRKRTFNLAPRLGRARLAQCSYCPFPRGKLVELESVGGQAHESQGFRFVWSCGDAAYRDGGADAFSRDAFRRQCWRLEVLQHRWN